MLKIEVKAMTGYENANATKLMESIAKMEKVINTEDFKNRVRDFTMPNGSKTFFFRPWQKKFSNTQVLNLILAATEEYEGGQKGVIDLYLHLEPGGDGSVVGYGNEGDKWINTYAHAFADMEQHEVAGHIFHEWLHKIGFVHDFLDLPKRKYSVPYAVGEILEELAEKST